MTRTDELINKKLHNEATVEELGELVDQLILEKNIPQFEEDTKKFVFKCKPCYQFQSIEFEVAATKDELDKVIDLYKAVLAGLQSFAPEQDKKVIKSEPLATDKQKQIMRINGIEFTSTTTMTEAQALIKESIERVR